MLFCEDDMALLAASMEKLLEMIRQWKDGMEQKGLRINMGKTKVMKCKVRQGQAENSGKSQCGVCRKGVGRNSICCTKWKKIKRCPSGVCRESSQRNKIPRKIVVTSTTMIQLLRLTRRQ
jgi:hypothetical protein